MPNPYHAEYQLSLPSTLHSSEINRGKLPIKIELPDALNHAAQPFSLPKIFFVLLPRHQGLLSYPQGDNHQEQYQLL